MKLRQAIIAGISALFITSCATPYGPNSNRNTGGYSETRYSPDVAKISFHGNALTSSEQAHDYSILRAGELCLQLGYKYFFIGSDKVDVSTSTIRTAGYSSTTGSVYGVSPFGANYSQSSVYQPGQTIDLQKPSATLLVKFFHRERKELGTLDAAFIVESLRGKYQLSPPK
jgi:hypothetical protein